MSSSCTFGRPPQLVPSIVSTSWLNAALMPSMLLGDDRQRRVVVPDAVAVLAVDAEEEQPGDAVVARVVLHERLRRQIRVGDVQAGAEHRAVVDREVVVDLDRVVVAVVPSVERIVGRLAELAADDDEPVAVRAADDVDRSVDRVDGDDVVVPVPVVVVVLGREGVDDDVARGRIDQRRRPDREQVVAGVTLEIERGVVAVDEERVVAGAAEDRRREADAVAQVAERRQRRREGVFRRDVGRDTRVRVRLADQEGVVTGAAVERRDRAVVVDRERVVAVAAVDGQPRVDVLVVVDPLDRVVLPLEDVVEGAVEQRDKSRGSRRTRCRDRSSPGGAGRHLGPSVPLTVSVSRPRFFAPVSSTLIT